MDYAKHRNHIMQHAHQIFIKVLTMNPIFISGIPTPSHLAGEKVNQDGRPGKVTLYVSSSSLYDFNLQFLFGSTSKTFPTMGKVFKRNITGPTLYNQAFKRTHYCRVAKEVCQIV